MFLRVTNAEVLVVHSVEVDIADIMGNGEEDHDDDERNLFDDLFLQSNCLILH